MIVVGVDPGRHGAVVRLTCDRRGNVWVSESIPLDHLSDYEIARAVSETSALSDWVVIERQQVRPRQSGALQIGRGYGILIGAALAVTSPSRVIDVTPQAWQKDLFGRTTKGDKGVAIEYAREHLPDLDLMPGRKRVPHDGIADAACIALWWIKQQEGQR